MKLTLINPSMGKIKGKKYIKTWSMEPINLGVIASLTPEDVEINFQDERFEDIVFENTDLVGISVETYTANRAYDIAGKFRERGIPVVLGGIHPTLIPEESREHSDAIVIGDAETVWKNVVEDARNGNLKKTYKSNIRQGPLEHIEPDKNIFDGRRYLPLGIVESGRGCKFGCDFCAVSGAYKGIYRSKNIEEIVGAVENTDKRIIYFADDNFVADFERTKELCDFLTPLRMNWSSHGSINMADDSELLRKLNESGCMNLLIGFESLKTGNLKSMGKSWTTANRDYSEAIKKLRDNGITIYATFVFGYDEDVQDDFKRTLDFAIDQKFLFTAFNHLVPYPGTPLYQRLSSEDRLLEEKWWLSAGYTFGDVAFKPRNMSPEELAEGCYDCRKQFYSYGSIFKRMMDKNANFKNLYQGTVGLVANLMSRKGIEERQWWPVGEIIENDR
tara:strand:- start:1976 stop:3313 length:1338 start_codon:yes stop_codon:yes gene_type:complete